MALSLFSKNKKALLNRCLDDSVTKDVAMGNQDHLMETPTVVIVSKGKREVIGGAAGMPYSILKQYLNQKIAQ